LLTGDDLEAFTDFMRESYQGWLDEVDHYLASLKAKPVDTIPADYERKQIGIVPSKQDYR
jgi:hypothetical protein